MSKDLENNNFNSEPNNFGLPEGYFKKSADSIFNRIEWMEEHEQYPCLKELKKDKGGFIIPENYFEHLETDLEMTAYPNLLKLKNSDNGFIVPENYFENAEIEELAKVLSDEENETKNFTILSSIKKQNCFIVEENYFIDSEQKIISNLSRDAKIIKLFKPKTLFSAVAAMLAIVLGLWLYSEYFKPAKGKDCGSLACLDKNDLIKTRNLESLDNEELYELVNTKKLEEKLEKKSEKKGSEEKPDSSLKNVNTDELLDEI